MTGAQYGLVELTQVLGNKYHDTENKAIQRNRADTAELALLDWVKSESAFSMLAPTLAPLPRSCLQRTRNFAKATIIFHLVPSNASQRCHSANALDEREGLPGRAEFHLTPGIGQAHGRGR